MKRKKSENRRVKSVKRKVLSGSIVLALILFSSSLVSLFEYARMNRVLTQQINENINSVNIARDMIMLTEDFNMSVLDSMGEPDVDTADAAAAEAAEAEAEAESEAGAETAADAGQRAEFSSIVFAREFDKAMEGMRSSFNQSTTQAEKAFADSVSLAYNAYMQVIGESDDLKEAGYAQRHDWYHHRLQPYYLKLRDHIRNLTHASQQALVNNSDRVDESYYRSLIPAVASVVVGLLVVMLFYYYLNYYVVSPLVRINKGIQGYRNFRKKYTVEVDNNGDELDQINSGIREIIEDQELSRKGSLD